MEEEPEIKQNSRVRWYELTSDTLILNTGLGIVIEWRAIPEANHGFDVSYVYDILRDDGSIRSYCDVDVELFEEWEDEV